MFRVLAVGGSPARPTVTQVLLSQAPDAQVSMVETSASARVVAADEEFDVGVIESPDDALAAQMVSSILEVAPLLPLIVVTDAEAGAPALFDEGAQDHLCRADLTQANLLRSCRHAIVRRAAAARAEAAARGDRAGAGTTEPEGEGTGRTGAGGLPEILLASTPEEPSDGVLATLARLLDAEPLGAITLERLRAETGLDEERLRRARRPLGNVLLYLIKRDLDAEAELVRSCFVQAAGQATSLEDAVHTTVRTFANFWRQSTASVRLASDFTGLDERLRDLRFEHLRRLGDAAVGFLADHRDEVVQADPDRALEVAVDQLLAVLDHQRLLGPLHPADGTPEEVIAEFAQRITVFLAGPPVARAAAPAPATTEPVAAEPPVREIEPIAVEPVAPPSPDPIAVAPPDATPEPVVATPPVATPEPVVATPPVATPEPVVATPPEPAVEPAPAVAAVEPEPPAVDVPPPVTEPEPLVAPAAVEDEDARVAAALRRLQAARTGSPAATPAPRRPTTPRPAATPPAEPATPAPAPAPATEPLVRARPRPSDDPFVTASRAGGAPGSPASPDAATPAPAAPSAATAPPAPTRGSLFNRGASVAPGGGPTFDLRRILIEDNVSARPAPPPPVTTDRPAAARLAARRSSGAPAGAAEPGAARTNARSAGASAQGGPAFDLDRIVVEGARVSVA